MEQAERARAAEQAAQRNAAARAAAAAAEAQRLTADRIAAAARLRHAEAATADAAARMDDLATRQREAQASLAAHAETMQPLLPLIERLSLFPAETLLAVPARAEDTLRGVLVLRGLAGQLGQEAVALRREQARLAAATAGPGGRSATAGGGAGGAAVRGRGARPADRRGRDGAPTGGRRGRGGGAARRQRSGASRNAARQCWWNWMPSAGRSRRGRAKRRGATASGRASCVRPAPARSPARCAAPWPAHRAGGGHASSASWGDATGGWAGHRHLVSRAAGGARRRGVCRSRGVRFPIPQLRVTVDRRLRWWLPCRARRLREARRQGRAGGGRRRTGRRHAGWEPGASGNRPALYVELRRDGQPVNPAPWLKASG